MQTNLEWQKADQELLGDEEERYREWWNDKVINGNKRTLGGNKCVHNLDCGNICQVLSNCTL